MPKLTIFLNRDEFYLSPKNKKESFDFSKMNFKVYFPHHSEIQIRFCVNHNLYQIWNSSLDCLVRLIERSHGLILDSVPVCPALRGPKTLKFGVLEDKGFLF